MEKAVARINPIGENAILVRFADQLSLEANTKAHAFKDAVQEELGSRLFDVTSNLVSTLVRYNPTRISYDELRQELSLIISKDNFSEVQRDRTEHTVSVQYGGENAPGLRDASKQLGISETEFVERHTASMLRALSLGFSPGFVYLGLHGEDMLVPRRKTVQEGIEAGAVLFAAGQSAITSRPIRTGWHVIGYTDFRNFDALASPPVSIQPGDNVRFEARM